MKNNLGDKIRKIRELKGYSQDYVSSQYGCSQNAWSKLENGSIRISEVKLDKIAKALEVEKDDILNFNDGIDNFLVKHQADIISPPPVKIEELYERIIEHLKSEVVHLRSILNKKPE